MQPPFGLVLCDRSPHQTSDTRLMDWLTLSSGTNATRDTHRDGATFNRSGSARSARNSLTPDYDTDPKPAVPSLNDEPGCIKVVDTFRGVIPHSLDTPVDSTVVGRTLNGQGHFPGSISGESATRLTDRGDADERYHSW